jgi:hypothetical protein
MTIIRADEYRRLKANMAMTGEGYMRPPEEWNFKKDPEMEFLDEEALAEQQRSIMGIRPSTFVEFAINIPDKKAQKNVPFSFEGRRYLRLPYDTPSKRTLYKCGRQVEKSTLLGNKCLAYCCINNAFNVLYVSPTHQQTKVFSRDRLKEPIETSEVLKAWTTTKLTDSVMEKQFINRSKISMRYAYHSADRTRGIPADMILIDEIQDILLDNIPVIEECASHSPFKIFIYSGTPKSLDNAIEKYWVNHSTQNEWVVPCTRHGTPNEPGSWHWNVLGIEHIGDHGLMCDKCKELINPMHEKSQWVSMNPGIYKDLEEPYEGYRIPQLMVPWLKWSEILDKQRKYPMSQFYNEVLGLSYDSGTRPLKVQDVMDNCREGQFMNPDILKKIRHMLGGASPVYAGIDWGTGEGSYTVLSLGAYIQDYFTIFYIHRFEGQETDPQEQLQLIEKLIGYWEVKLIATDYGGGFDRNDYLTRKYGKDKIMKYQYSTPNMKVKYEPGLKRFLVHRTEVMSDIFNAIKRRDVFRFPDWKHFQDPFAQDMLNIFSEYNEQLRQIQYKKSPDRTDDSFHSILLCFLGSLILHPRYDVLNPNAKTNTSQDD